MVCFWIWLDKTLREGREGQKIEIHRTRLSSSSDPRRPRVAKPTIASLTASSFCIRQIDLRPPYKLNGVSDTRSNSCPANCYSLARVYIHAAGCTAPGNEQVTSYFKDSERLEPGRHPRLHNASHLILCLLNSLTGSPPYSDTRHQYIHIRWKSNQEGQLQTEDTRRFPFFTAFWSNPVMSWHAHSFSSKPIVTQLHFGNTAIVLNICQPSDKEQKLLKSGNALNGCVFNW